MSFVEDWSGIATRIRALSQTGSLYAQFLAGNSNDSYGAGKALGSGCQRAQAAVEEFVSLYRTVLPKRALVVLDGYLNSNAAQVVRSEEGAREAKASLVFLANLKAEVSHLISDKQELLRSRTERALIHLQRLIVVDAASKKNWSAAFRKGEVACEALGAVHLLWHGIWAFKVDAKGERTDLVYKEPVESVFEPRAAEGLVLTEWKIVDNKTAAKQFESARKQAAAYKVGALAGVELTQVRFMIGVSEQNLKKDSLPGDMEVDGVTYRHVNIAVAPKTPSKR